ncbi:HdeD family acid-resistance protein [Brevibacterium sp. FAM 27836]|uniref:HdeD family acid-resistance protein n=1 Tax=Brevibacterium sp. FAM 27836 TaxID=3446693 RepID=UPI003F51ABAB
MSTEEPRTESTSPRSEASPQAIAAAKRLGTPMVVRGLLGVVFGIATVFWPRDDSNPLQLSMPTDVVDHLAIGYLILFALALVFEAVRAPLNVRTAIYGQAVIAIPAIVFLFLADHPAELRAALSIWALLHGALEFWAYRQLKSQPMASDFLIAAGTHALLGIILVFGDGMEALSILGFTGAAALIAGVIFIIGGYSRLSKGRQLAKRGEPAEQIGTPAEAATSDDSDESDDGTAPKNEP